MTANTTDMNRLRCQPCLAVLFSTLAYCAQWRDKAVNESASSLTLNPFSPVDAALARAPPVGLAHSLGRCELAAKCPSALESLSQPSACQAMQPILVPRLGPVKHNRINRFAPEQCAFTLVLPTCDINALCAWFHGMEAQSCRIHPSTRPEFTVLFKMKLDSEDLHWNVKGEFN
jgi:hypothetical protein